MSYLTLFLSALLAATLIPFSSEALLGTMATMDDYDILLLFACATAGNVLGSVINWGLGLYCLHWQDRKWFPFKEKETERASRWFNRYGLWSLLLAWVPIIGDPLTFVAGILRVRFISFLILVSISKASRYAVVLGLVDVFTAI